jgi:hypothetical protein
MRVHFFRRISGVLLVMTAALYVPHAVSAATLVLKDGAVIHGEIEALQGDVYTVKTALLGSVRVRKQDIRSIDHGGEHTVPSAGSSPERADLEAMQSRMLQSPGLLSMIQSLQSDPEVQAVLADPEIVEALASGNYAVLMNHPKIIALTRNAKVREVIDEAR